MKNKLKLIYLVLGVLAVIIICVFLIQRINVESESKQSQSKTDQSINAPIVKIKQVSKNNSEILRNGIIEPQKTIASSNKEKLTVQKASVKKDVVSIYQCDDMEYYIIRIRATDRTNKHLKENIFYGARITDKKFERTTRFYHLSNQIPEGDYFVANYADFVYVFGWVPNKNNHFEVNGQPVSMNKEGLTGVILNENQPNIEIKKDGL